MVNGPPPAATGRSPTFTMTCTRVICLAYWLALTVGLLHPKGGTLPRLHFGFVGDWFNVAHFLAFAVLAGLVRASRLPWGLLWSLTPLCAYAVLTEVVQVGVPGRSGRLADVLANVFGIAAGMMVARIAFGRGDRRRCR